MSRAARVPSSVNARSVLTAVALIAVTFLAYAPALRGGWIWDDDYYVTRNTTLRSLDGLGRIWFEVGAVPQYYPMTHSTFWLEWRLWGDDPTGYHAANVLLHCASAILIGVILRRLAVPGWWVVPWVFALHPVHVESVAWVTERKNVLSGFLYLVALLTYLRWAFPQTSNDKPQLAAYLLALVLFVCALLSKSVTSSLPAVVLLIVYWKRGRIGWRDAAPLVPFFALGVAMGLLTSWMERHVVGAQGPEWDLSFLERALIAGRAVWFYATKLLWPHPLIFMYPRWRIDDAAAWQYAFPLAALGVVVALWWLRRRIGRGPLVAALFFGGTLFPALGFVNVLPMRYSFVADHFQYLASLGLITLFATAIAVWLPRRSAVATTALVCVALAVLTWRHAHDFRDIETLWRNTLTKNPSSWMAHNNYGTYLFGRGDYDAAAERFRRVIELKPEHPESRLNLGLLAERRGQPQRARELYLEALRVRPGFANAYYNLGRLETSQGRVDEAIGWYRRAIEADARHDEAHVNLGVLFADRGDFDRAAQQYRRALEVNPQSAAAHVNLGNVYLHADRIDDALAEWAKAARLQPENPVIRNNIGTVRAAQGKLDEAEREFRAALAARPDYVEALTNLGIVRARRGDAAGARQFLARALALDPGNEKAKRQLDALRK